jgi:large subunit ribosomal protein L35
MIFPITCHLSPVTHKGVIMPKLKTHKGAAKRLRLTATGKVKRGHSHARHILTKKTHKRKRNLDIDTLVSESDMERVKNMLPYGRS